MIAFQNICVAKGQVTMSHFIAKRWFKRVRDGEFSLQDDLRSERPTEINLAELKYAPESESDQSTRNIPNKFGPWYTHI